MCKNTIISRMTETIHEKRDQKSRCVSEDIISSLISKNEKQERGIIMKRMKKIASLLLALVMVLTMTTTAFAAQEGTLTGGTITIKNAVEGQKYNAYQILYLESYNKDTKAYSYKANSAWKSWLKEQKTYVSFNSDGYVTWKEGADAAAFAKAALAYAKQQSFEADATVTATKGADETVTASMNELKLGYYLVDSTLGTLCSLDTTNPSAEIEEKNAQPTIVKKVQEDSTSEWGDSNSAQIGQTVEFKTTINAKKGAQNYVLHDKMDKGLTLNANSITVKVGETELTKDTDYTVVFDTTDGCTFEIKFVQTYLDKITEDTTIVVTYSAVLNKDAKISEDPNNNKTKLDYGDESETEWDETKTYTFKFDIIKTDSNKKLLSGAKFELYDAATGGNKIALVKESEGVYRVATPDEKEAEGFTSAVIEAGKVTVKGLDSDLKTTYWLEEIEAPAGYNKLNARVEVKMTEGKNLETTMTGDTWAEENGGVQITNQSGTELPSTGGIGTTIFYVIGAILVIGSAVLLITKKRMSNH